MRKVSQLAPIAAEIKKISSLEIFLLQRKAGIAIAKNHCPFASKPKKIFGMNFVKYVAQK